MNVKSERLWWYNVLFVVTYAVLALFVDANGQLFGWNLGISTVLLYGLLLGGIAVALLSLVKMPRRWLLPAVCLAIYFAFLLFPMWP